MLLTLLRKKKKSVAVDSRTSNTASFSTTCATKTILITGRTPTCSDATRKNRIFVLSCWVQMFMAGAAIHGIGNVGCLAFSSPPLPLPHRNLATFLVPQPQPTTSRRQFRQHQGGDDNDNYENYGMYDGGEIYDTSYYDGEYDVDLFDDSNTSGAGSTTNAGAKTLHDKTKKIKKDSVNAELNRWFQDRNQIQPILLTDLLHPNSDDDEFDDDLHNLESKSVEPPLVPVEDFSWFEPTLLEIESKYEQRREQLELSLDNDRRSTPRTVPLEANSVMEQILQEEMKTEIKQCLDEMRRERINRMTEQTKNTVQSSSSSSSHNQNIETVEGLVQAEQDPILANAASLVTSTSVEKEEAKLSRKQALYVAAQAVPLKSRNNIETSTGDDDDNLVSLDYWAMDRAEESLLKRKSRNRQQEIDQKLQRLREQMERKANIKSNSGGGGSSSRRDNAFQPENYADWKKYQEIKAVEKAKSVDGIVDEAIVLQKLIDYKEFMARQELTLEAFHEEEDELQHELEVMRQYIAPERKQQPRKFTDVVADINRKSLILLEQVLEKRRSVDGGGTEELEERIAKLREYLEEVNYVDVKFAPKAKKKKVFKDEPIDFTEVFPTQAARLKGEGEPTQRTEQRTMTGNKKRSKRAQEFADLDLMLGDVVVSRETQQLGQPAFDFRETPPNFYYSSEDDEEEEEIAPPPPPKTAFFSSLLEADTKEEVDEDLSAYVMSESDINKPAELRSTSLLGTFEEQRLKNMYRQAGAVTEEEQEQLRKSMEEFQRYQEEMMKKYEEMDETDLGYDIADVLTEDGDINAEKVLSYIKAKPVIAESVDSRPTFTQVATKGDSIGTPSSLSEALTSQEQDTAIAAVASKAQNELVFSTPTQDVANTIDTTTASSTPASPKPVTPTKEVTFPLTFSGESDINAPPEKRDTALLGTYEEQRLRNLIRETGLKDKEEQEKFKSEFEQFQRYQDEAMKKFEEEEKLAAEAAKGTLVEEAQIDETTSLPLIQVTSSVTQNPSNVVLGPKASTAERKRRLAQGSIWKPPNEVVDQSNPERGRFLGQDSFDAEIADDDAAANENEIKDDEDDFEENQRRIEQALGVRRPKGIDIYDALGRRPGDRDYEDDYKRDEYAFPLRRSDVDLSSYQLRKAMMLERTSISIMEVNSLMDMKDNLEVEGISPYMARVNKPFKEFGAIFRLEGVLVDISALEFRAWYRVAADVNMNPPSREDVRFASVQNAEYAVSRIFHWTNDYLLCREIAEIHSRFLKEEVKAALDSTATGAFLGKTERDEKTIIKDSSEKESSESFEHNSVEYFKKQKEDLTKKMYIAFAEKYGFRKPTDSELEIAIQLPPLTAVEVVFEWSSERNPIDNIVAVLKQIYESERRKMNKSLAGVNKDVVATTEATMDPEGEALLTVTDGAVSWINALIDVEMPCGLISYLDEESVDLIMKKTGLATLIPPEQRVTLSSGYTRDTFQQLGACLRIDRRPDMCVVFDGNADALNAARDNEMKSVGMTSVYPSYELLAADMTARNFDYLTAMNIRRLFGGRENQEPLLQVLIQEPDRPKRKLMTMYPDDERGDDLRRDDKDDFYVDDTYRDDADRYYGDDKYVPQQSSPADGVLYDEGNGSDLFQ